MRCSLWLCDIYRWKPTQRWDYYTPLDGYCLVYTRATKSSLSWRYKVRNDNTDVTINTNGTNNYALFLYQMWTVHLHISFGSIFEHQEWQRMWFSEYPDPPAEMSEASDRHQWAAREIFFDSWSESRWSAANGNLCQIGQLTINTPDFPVFSYQFTYSILSTNTMHSRRFYVSKISL